MCNIIGLCVLLCRFRSCDCGHGFCPPCWHLKVNPCTFEKPTIYLNASNFLIFLVHISFVIGNTYLLDLKKYDRQLLVNSFNICHQWIVLHKSFQLSLQFSCMLVSLFHLDVVYIEFMEYSSNGGGFLCLVINRWGSKLEFLFNFE